MIKKSLKHAQFGMLSLAATLFMSPVHADEMPETLRVCAAANELPYSNNREEGFENQIAKVLASSMDLPLEFVWSDRAAIFLVTEHLLRNECDVVIGVDEGDPRVGTSEPYYTSGYVFIYRSDRDIDVSTWESEDLQAMNHFVVIPGSPSELALRKIGKFEGNFNYTKSLANYKSARNQYIRLEPTRLINEVVTGNGDIAHLWAPEVARYVNNSSAPLTMVMSEPTITMSNGDVVEQHYAQSVAVRSGDTALLKAINRALTDAAPQITAILQEEGVPLL